MDVMSELASRIGPMLIGVGVPQGVAEGDQRSMGRLRRGTELVTVDAATYHLVLRAAMIGARDHVGDWLKTRHGVDDAQHVIDRALAQDLIRVIPPDAGWEFFSGLRLQTTGFGHGAVLDDHALYRIAVPDLKPVDVDGFAYLLWMASDGRSLARVLEQVQAVTRLDRKPAETAAVHAVIKLLRGGAAYLDLVAPDRR